jgi:hypothetical protein
MVQWTWEESTMFNVLKQWAAASVIGLTLFGAAGPAAAAGAVTAKIYSLTATSDGTIIVKFTIASIPGKPACSIDFDTMAFTATSDGGKALYSAVLSAHLAGKTVFATGTNACITPVATGRAVERLSTVNF